MRNFKKGFAWLPALFVLAGMLAVSGVAYWYLHQKGLPQPLSAYLRPATTSTTTPENSTPTKGSTNGEPTAKINQGTIGYVFSDTASPEISGTATNLGLVEIYLIRSDGYAYGDGTLGLDHGATVVDNRWSFATHSLPDGTYTIKVTLPDMPSGSLPPGSILTTGTLIVATASPASKTETVEGKFAMSKLGDGVFVIQPAGWQQSPDSALIILSQPEKTERAFGIDPTVPPPQCEYYVSATIEINNRQPSGPIGIGKKYTADLVRIITKGSVGSACI
jgi:hypothetical protein